MMHGIWVIVCYQYGSFDLSIWVILCYLCYLKFAYWDYGVYFFSMGSRIDISMFKSNHGLENLCPHIRCITYQIRSLTRGLHGLLRRRFEIFCIFAQLVVYCCGYHIALNWVERLLSRCFDLQCEMQDECLSRTFNNITVQYTFIHWSRNIT